MTNNIFNFKNSLLENTKLFFLLLFFTALFFGHKFIVWTLYPLTLFFLYELFKDKFNVKKNYSLILLISFYLIHIVSCFFSNNYIKALDDLKIKLSIIIFSIIFVIINKSFIYNTKKILNIFIFSSIISGLFLFINSVIYFLNVENMPYYTLFSTHIHPSYISLFFNFNLLISLYFIFKKNNRITLLYLLLSITLSLFCIYFSDSKSGYLGAIIIILFFLISIAYKKSKLLTSAFILIILISFFFILKNNYRFNTALNSLKNINHTFDKPEQVNSSSGMRLLAWNAGYKLIKQNLFFGVGIGDVKDNLILEYQKLNYKHLKKLKLNAHNQFIETWIGLGIIGFIILILVLVIPFINAVRSKNIILQGFLILIFINFLFESILNRFTGVIFFAFFYSILVITNNTKKSLQ